MFGIDSQNSNLNNINLANNRNSKKLCYRSIKYNQKSTKIVTNPEKKSGKYRGQNWSINNSNKPVLLPKQETLTYRGVTYNKTFGIVVGKST